MTNFPFNAISRPLRKTIYHFEDITQAPAEIIASSVLCAVSLACQSLIKVKITDNIISPVSLYSLVIADSGERKTTVDKLVFKPFHEHDRRVLRECEGQQNDYDAKFKLWCEEEKALSSLIRKKRATGLCIIAVSQQLQALYAEKPVPPKARKYIYNNVTPEALQLEMYTNSPQTGLITDEGANILDRQAMNDPGFINSMWDGADFSVNRKTGPSFTIRDGSLTLLVMTQKPIFDDYLKRQGKRARGSGLFARCFVLYIDKELSTQGQRLICRQPDPQADDLKYTARFYQRMNELLEKNASHNGEEHQTCLSFEPSAQKAWEEIHDEIELRIGSDEEYANLKDFSSKQANNVARLAALLSYFIEGECAIKKEYVENAWSLCEWYMQQATKLFGNEDGYYEALLLSWLRREFDETDVDYVRFNSIRNSGPNKLRKGKLLEKVIDRLEKEGVIDIGYSERHTRQVDEGRHFYNNSFTKNAAYKHY